MDRIILGQHANTLLNEVGLYASKPGANVLDPQTYLDGNLMFSSTDTSSLNLIQSGAFKITCEREAVSLDGKTVFRGSTTGQKVYQVKLKDIFASGSHNTPCHPLNISNSEGEEAYHEGSGDPNRRDKFIWATHYRVVGDAAALQAAVDFGASVGVNIPYDTWADNRDTVQRAMRDEDTLWFFYMDVAGAESNAHLADPNYPGAGFCEIPFYETRYDSEGLGTGNLPSGYESSSLYGGRAWIWDGDVAHNPINGMFVPAGKWGEARDAVDQFGRIKWQSFSGYGGWDQQTDLILKTVIPIDYNTGEPGPEFAGVPADIVPSDLKRGAMLRLPRRNQGGPTDGISHQWYSHSQDPMDSQGLSQLSFESYLRNFSRAADFWMACLPFLQVPPNTIPYQALQGQPNGQPDRPVTDPNWNSQASYEPYIWALHAAGGGIGADGSAFPASVAVNPRDGQGGWAAGFGATVNEVTLLGIPQDQFFYHDTRRPAQKKSTLWSIWNRTVAEDMDGNYIDRGNITIPIINQLPDGEIPEVAIRFAVGSSGEDGKQVRFHPWYANVAAPYVAGGWAPNWDDFTYTNEDEIVHMDSPWARFKWGGIGDELYSGMDLHEKTREAWLLKYSEEFLQILEGVGFAFPSDTNVHGNAGSRKLYASALGHSIGATGLFHFSNSTHLSVEAHMTPTHTGTRKPVLKDDPADIGNRRNAIEDYANIRLKPWPDGALGSDWDPPDFTNFEYLPRTHSSTFGGPPAQLEGTDILYGWLGHPTQYFFNPFSNNMCTFHTNLQPPFLYEYNGVEYPLHYYGRHDSLEYDHIRFTSQKTDADGVTHDLPAWGPHVAIDSQADSDAFWLHTGMLHGTGGIQWPPGHEFGNWTDDLQWQGSMGMGGAGPAGTLGLSPGDSNCWDTYYCSYVIYSHGRKPEVSAQQSNTITVSARSSTLPGGNMINPLKYRGDADDDDMRYFNLNFPDDFVGEVGNTATDPFHNHRDESGRIYGSLNIIFEIPEYDTPGVDPMYIGSEEFEQFFEKTGPGTGEFKIVGKPKPAITFDLSGRNFNFINNNNLNLIIKNHGIVLGGGGAGGYGGHYNYDLTARGSLKTPVGGAPLKIGGGGGGAGGGSGRGHVGSGTLQASDLAYAGTGKAGSGYGRALLIGGQIEEEWVAEMQGETGTDMVLHTSAHANYRNVSGGAGGLAGTKETINRVDSLQPDKGSDGGDCFFIVHDDTYLPNIEIINIGSGSNSTQVNDAMIRSGGGGAGGGAGGEPDIVNDRTSAKVFGATGAAAGYNGNPDTSTSGANSRYQWPGGAAGYLVGAYADSPFDLVDVEYNVGWPEVVFPAVTPYPEDTEAGIYDKLRSVYTGKITVRNEASTETIYARHPNGSTTPGTAGWSLGVGYLEYEK